MNMWKEKTLDDFWEINVSIKEIKKCCITKEMEHKLTFHASLQLRSLYQFLFNSVVL